MRSLRLIALPLLLCATPALAQQSKTDTLEKDMQIPPELKDPALANRLVDALQVLSKSFLSLPAGEVEAALEGRRPTRADRSRTIASETGMSEAELKRKLDESRPMMAASQKALMDALPTMMGAMAQMGRDLEKAAANMPQPGYPKR